jgi:hypothetical protein
MAARRPLPDSSALYAASLPTRLTVSRTSLRHAVRQLFCGREPNDFRVYRSVANVPDVVRSAFAKAE